MPKYCCKDCFEPETVKEYIKANGVGRRVCHFCGYTNAHCIDPRHLADLFSPILGLYSRIEEFMPLDMMKEFEGQTLTEKLIENWEPFTDDDYDNVSELLSEMFDNGNPFEDSFDFDSWVENPEWYWGVDEPSDEMKRNWEAFCEEITNNNRYFPQKSIDLNILDSLTILQLEKQPGDLFYRARKSAQKKTTDAKRNGHAAAPFSYTRPS